MQYVLRNTIIIFTFILLSSPYIITMKKILTLLAVALVGLSVFTGCRKYDYEPSMVAAIDSIDFSAATRANVTAIVDTTTHNPQLVTIEGKGALYTPGSAVKPSIKIVVPNARGTYYVGFSGTSAIVYTSANSPYGSQALGGTVNVLGNKDGKIQGNFNLNCADGTKVTGGQFIGELDYE